MNQLNLEQAMSSARAIPELPRPLQAVEYPYHSADSIAARSVTPVWLLFGAAFLCVCAMFWVHGLGSHDCRTKPLPLVFGFSTELAVTMPAGVPCTIAVQPGGSVHQLTIEAEPENGTLAARGRTGVTYRPNPRFKGEDRFVFSLAGGSNTPHETSAIHVRALVK